MIKNLIPAFLLLIAAACSSTPDIEIPEEIASLENLAVIEPDAEPQNSFEFEPEARYGETAELIFGNINGATVAPDGRVFLADFDQNSLHAFDPDGNYLTTLGGEGEGPGEFGNISNPQADENFLYAYDWTQRRINAFDLETLRFSHTVRLMREDWSGGELSGKWPNGYFVTRDGSFLTSFSPPFSQNNLHDERQVSYYRITSEGELIPNEVFAQRAAGALVDESGGGFMVMGSPFRDRPLFALAPDDRFYTAWSEDFLIRIYSSQGEYERAIYVPYEKSFLDQQELASRYDNDRLRRMIRTADAPEHWPALHQIRVDDEHRIWAATIIDDEDLYQWWVISPEGELQSRFEWPRNRNIRAIQNGYLYVQETDPETDLQEIVRYRIVEG